ncbi:MAG TPA: hypothetical protein VHB77_03300 [Planctomycetaceae bacterium]|nr:hypothetical protein [Planctomycetaceae bacterium]
MMQHCPGCGIRLEPAANEESADADRPALPRRTDVVQAARFTNAAEAGFFMHELETELGVTGELEQREHFNAIHGTWHANYALLVARDDAPRVAEFLRDLRDETEVDAGEWRAPGQERPAEVGSLSSRWMPMLITLAAGSVAYLGVTKLEEPPRPPALRADRPADTLWRELARGDWSQTHPEGKGTRRMRMDAARRTVLVEEDKDADGHFERAHQFPLPR